MGAGYETQFAQVFGYTFIEDHGTSCKASSTALIYTDMSLNYNDERSNRVIGIHNPSTPTCSPLQDQQNMLELERFGHAGGCGEARHVEGEKAHA